MSQSKEQCQSPETDPKEKKVCELFEKKNEPSQRGSMTSGK